MTPQEQVDELFRQITPGERLRLWDFFQASLFPHRDVREELHKRAPMPEGSKPPPLPKEHTRVRAVAK